MSKPILKTNVILEGDCIELLKTLPEKSIDLVFADPPYNLQLKGELWRPNNTKVSAVDDDWDKYDNFIAYDDFTAKWLAECRRVLKDNGSLWVIGSYHNIFRVGKAMQDLGYWILNDILWIKTNPMPNFKGTRFNNSHETLIWAAKSEKSKPIFNYKTMKTHNEDKQMRSDWLIPICSGQERVKINGVKAHSTQKPLALLRRIISASTKPGDVVLDPFLGSGTTAVAAKELGRLYIGLERDSTYVSVAKMRLADTIALSEEHISSKLEVKAPRVAFGLLVDIGLIKAGTRLTSKDGRYVAMVTANGSLKSGGIEGSIHKVGAILQKQPACNGWTFWHMNGTLINDIRQKYLEQIDAISDIQKIFDEKIFEKSKSDLLKKVAEYPDRYVGLFRPSKPEAKLLQNLLQSNEIRFGDAFEVAIKQYFIDKGWQSLPQKITSKEGDALNIDQLLIKEDKVLFIEQKIRDDHDSTKKRGQVSNFEKKLEALLQIYGNKLSWGFFYFIDPAIIKNKGFYQLELKKLQESWGVPLSVSYGQELFEQLGYPDIWPNIIKNLQQWRHDIPGLPNINFDSAPQESAQEIKDLPLRIFRKLFDDERITSQILPVLFPTGATLRILLAQLEAADTKIHNHICKNINVYLKSRSQT